MRQRPSTLSPSESRRWRALPDPGASRPLRPRARKGADVAGSRAPGSAQGTTGRAARTHVRALAVARPLITHARDDVLVEGSWVFILAAGARGRYRAAVGRCEPIDGRPARTEGTR